MTTEPNPEWIAGIDFAGLRRDVPRLNRHWERILPLAAEALSGLFANPIWRDHWDAGVDQWSRRLPDAYRRQVLEFLVCMALVLVPELEDRVGPAALRQLVLAQLNGGAAVALGGSREDAAQLLEAFGPRMIAETATVSPDNRLAEASTPELRRRLRDEGFTTKAIDELIDRWTREYRDHDRSYEEAAKRGRRVGSKPTRSEAELQAIADAQAMKAPLWAARYPCGVSGKEKALDPANPDDQDAISERWRRARKIKPTR